MSKTSAKARITQLQEWLEGRKTVSSNGNTKKFSKADHYKQNRKRYGSKKSY